MRVSILSDTGRADLVIPRGLPVAELLPDLARRVGLVEPRLLASGLRLTTVTGRRLSEHQSLALQGVPDGAVLALAPRLEPQPPPVHDDLAETVVGAVRQSGAITAAGRRLAMRVIAGSVLAVGLLALLLGAGVDSGTAPTAAASGVGGLTLLVSAGWLSRGGHDLDALIAAWAAVGFAAAGPSAVAPGSPWTLTWVGCGVVSATGLAAPALARGRIWLTPAPVIGAALILSGIAHGEAGVRPAVTLSTLAALAVLAAGALGPATAARIRADPRLILTDVQTAHDRLLAATIAAGVLVVASAPLVPGLGHAGGGLALATALAFGLAGRHDHHPPRAMLRLGAGSLAAVLASTSYVVQQPAAGPILAAFAALIGVLALLAHDRELSLRGQRWIDWLESASLLGLLPLLMVTTGLVAAVRS